MLVVLSVSILFIPYSTKAAGSVDETVVWRECFASRSAFNHMQNWDYTFCCGRQDQHNLGGVLH